VQGFDPQFSDFPGFILGVTREIWEGRNIASLKQYYAPDIIVRSPASVVIGNDAVMAATLSTLAEFPDRQLLGEDVIWSGTPETGLLSSHRLISTATHVNDGAYGSATGAQLRYRILADCHAMNNQINDEWLVRDQAAIVRQMGRDVRDYARQLIEHEGGPQNCVTPLSPQTDQQGPYRGHGNDNEWGQLLADTLRRIMNADFSVIETTYDRAVHADYPGGESAHGRESVDNFWMGLRASFPSATFAIHHQIGRHDSLMPPRAALRWSLTGCHDGWGRYGKPTGARVYVMGITHAEFGSIGVADASLRREFTLIDDCAIWTQILLQTG